MKISDFNSYKVLASYLVILCALCLIMACELKNPSHAEKKSASTKNARVKPELEIVGEWEKKYPFAVTNISFLPDGRFKYKHQGCLGISYTEGTWSQGLNQINLNSDSSYKIETTEIAKIFNQLQGDSLLTTDMNSLSIVNQSNKIKAFRFDSMMVYFAGRKLYIREGKLADAPFRTTDTLWEYRKIGGTVIGRLQEYIH